VSDLNSRQAGESGLDLPAGGNLDDWQAGRSIRDWNNAELERQQAAGSVPLSGAPIAPVRPPPFSPFGRNAGPVQNSPYARGNPFGSIVGLLLLIFVGAPLYRYSIPLWACLYPAAGLIVGAIWLIGFVWSSGNSLLTGSGHLVFPTIFAFIAAWPLTMIDQGLAVRRKGYWVARHLVRLALTGVWVLYCLSIPKNPPPNAVPQIPDLVVDSQHLWLALGGMVVMHFFLTKRPLGLLKRRAGS
jgi:hypothetical protein